MRAAENEKRDWTVIALILLLGLLALLLAGSWALRFTPLWELDASVESYLDPNSDFLTHKPEGFIEPVDPAILTNPAWLNAYLTPGVTLPATTGASLTTPTVSTVVTAQTASPTIAVSATNTSPVSASPTNTLIYFPPSTSMPKPKPVVTSTDIATSTPNTSTQPSQTSTGGFTATLTSTASSTPSPTATATTTATPTATLTATDTPTNTSTPSATLPATNTPSPTPTSTNVPLAWSCFSSPVNIGASGTYAIPAGGSCLRFPDPGFANGGVFTVQELSGTSGSLVWYGKTDPASTSCSTYPQAASLPANGSVTIAVHKFFGYMYVEVSGTTSVQIDIVDWNDLGCP